MSGSYYYQSIRHYKPAPAVGPALGRIISRYENQLCLVRKIYERGVMKLLKHLHEAVCMHVMLSMGAGGISDEYMWKDLYLRYTVYRAQKIWKWAYSRCLRLPESIIRAELLNEIHFQTSEIFLVCERHGIPFTYKYCPEFPSVCVV